MDKEPSLEKLVAYYRMLAKDARDKAAAATTQELREQYTVLAEGWLLLADQTQHLNPSGAIAHLPGSPPS